MQIVLRHRLFDSYRRAFLLLTFVYTALEKLDEIRTFLAVLIAHIARCLPAYNLMTHRPATKQTGTVPVVLDLLAPAKADPAHMARLGMGPHLQ